jgi:hypothetical protein
MLFPLGFRICGGEVWILWIRAKGGDRFGLHVTLLWQYLKMIEGMQRSTTSLVDQVTNVVGTVTSASKDHTMRSQKVSYHWYQLPNIHLYRMRFKNESKLIL